MNIARRTRYGATRRHARFVVGAAALGAAGLLITGAAIPAASATGHGSVGTVKLDGKDLSNAGDPANDPKQTCDVVLEWQGFPAGATQTVTVKFTAPGHSRSDPTVTSGRTSLTFVGHGQGSAVVDQKETYRLAGADLVKVTVTVQPAGYHKSKVFKYQPCTAPGVPDMTIDKADAVDPVSPGANISYTLTARNTGDTVITAFKITDAVTAPLTWVSTTSNTTGLTCSSGASVLCTYAGSLAKNATASVTVVAQVPASFTGTSVSNTAVVGPVTGASYDSDTEATGVTQPTVMTIDKVDAVDPVSPGANITYTLTATNIGNTAITSFKITDAVTAPLTWVSTTSNTTGLTCNTGASVLCTYAGSLAKNATASVTVVAHVPATFTGTSVSNTAVVGPTSGPAYDSDTETTRVTQPGPPPLPPAPVLTPDLSIAKTGPAAVKPGDNVTYTLTVTNVGTGVASNVQVTDALPTGLTLVSASGTGFTCTGTTQLSCLLAGTLAPATSAVVNVVATLATSYAATSVANTAVVLPTDSNPANNTDTEVTPVTLPVPVVPQDLGITKTALATSTSPGLVLSWTLTVTNVKGTPASAFTVTDEVPFGLTLLTVGGVDWTCATSNGVVTCTYTGAPLAVGASASFQLDALVAGDYVGTTVSNTAIVDPGGVDPSNDTATSITPVVQQTSGGGGGEAVVPTPSPSPSGGGGGGGEALPFTGSYTDLALGLGVAALVAGLVLALIGRRRHSTR